MPHNGIVEAVRLAGRSYAAGENSYRYSMVKALARLAAYPWALCNMRAASDVIAPLPSGGLLCLCRATRSTTLQTVKARGSSFCLATRLTHETRGPFSQVQCVGYQPR